MVFDIENGWHIYGNPVGPGIGKETVISAEAPEGFQLQASRYSPAHKKEQDFGEAGKTWVWEHTGRAIHHLSGRVAPDIAPGQFDLTVEVSAQVCSPGTCLPGTATVPLKVDVVAPGSPSRRINSDLFSGFNQAKSPPSAEPQ